MSEDAEIAQALGKSIKAASSELAARWLERISARVTLHPIEIFPSQEMLNHIPILIDGIADYVADAADAVAADMPVIGKAIELGNLRHEQGFAASEILKEYEILGSILFDFVITSVDAVEKPGSQQSVLRVADRLFRAVLVILQVTADEFLRASASVVREREQRLRGFNGAVSHEVRNRLGLLSGAIGLLQEEFIQRDPERVQHFAAMLNENARGLLTVVDDLVSLSRVGSDTGQQRNVLLGDAIQEAVRQLREFAAARGVRVKVAEDIPAVEVAAAAVELCVANYISNAIKYHDPAKTVREVEVRARVDGQDTPQCKIVIEVQDNGLGVPESARADLFKRFFRAHGTVTAEEGSGLGLSIVRDVAESGGGRAWADFSPDGRTIFAFEMPCITAPALLT